MNPENQQGDERMGVRVVWLREVRQSRGLSQHQLAERSGLARDTISKLELGGATASIRVIHQLARGLDLPVGALLREVVEREESSGPRWR